MNYKNHLLSNYKKIYEVKEMLENLDNHIIINKINEKVLDNDTISIVMTTFNRPVQTYFTLDTISKSKIKNIQVIIVDDSNSNTVKVEDLQKYNMHIELINIKSKIWSNPCINYNIGFKQIRGGKVVIQNAEVCHIGDVLSYVNDNIKEGEYNVFDVGVLKDEEVNNALYKLGDMSFDNYNNIKELITGWYQNSQINNRCFHFLTAISKKDLDIIVGFDIDYCIGSWRDDVDFIFRVRSSNIVIKNVLISNGVLGIHQWHVASARSWDRRIPKNHPLYNFKVGYFKENNKFFNLTDYPINEVEEIIKKIF